MIRTMKALLLPLILLVLLTLVACGSTDESRSLRDVASSAPGAPGQPGVVTQSSEDSAEGVRTEKQVIVEMQSAAPVAPGLPTLGGEGSDEELQALQEVEAELATQDRIIVRTVNMQLVVDDLAQELDNIADLAQEFGGWVVSSDRSQKHSGFISIRVPADKLDDTILRLRELAVEVDAETTTSSENTDEVRQTVSWVRLHGRGNFLQPRVLERARVGIR